MNNRYSLFAAYAIGVIIIGSIFFTSFSNEAGAENAVQNSTKNRLYRQAPRDNDDNYRLPTYIPTHSLSLPKKKIEFKKGSDNDALYYTPVQVPKNAPKRIVRPAPKRQVAPQPVYVPTPQPAPAPTPQYQPPLQPQPRQPQAPVYTPQYQYQPQQFQPAPAYQAPAAQQVETADPEYYPYYYY